MSELETIVRAHLQGLDDDILDYVLSMIGDSGLADEDVREQVGMFLISAEYCEDEDAASATLNALNDKLQAGGAAPEVQDTLAEEAMHSTRLREEPLTMGGEEDEQEEEILTPSMLGSSNHTMETMSAKMSKRESRKAKRAEDRLKDAAAQRKAGEAAIGISQIQSAAGLMGGAQAGFEEGGYAGNIQLSMFDLPNKKGSGADLLVNASITFAQGRRYGLVGKNGVGKSTFMEAINAREIHGLQWCRQSILLVKQEVEGNHLSPLDWVLMSDGRRAAVAAQIEELSKVQTTTEEFEVTEADRLEMVDLSRFALQKVKQQKKEKAEAEQLEMLCARLAELDATSGEAQAATILFGLGFNHEMQGRPTDDLSGGWRRRVALACALFVKPDVLLLDEPTNHLDIETVIWLERYLVSEEFIGTCIIVSHDRNFLNETCTDIVNFSNGKLVQYKGDYFAFISAMEQAAITKKRQREAQEMKREHMQEYIDKHAKMGENGPKAAAQRKSRMKKMDRLGVEAASANKGGKFKASNDGDAEEVEEEQDENEFSLNFPDPGKVDGTIVQLDEVSFSYPAKKEKKNRVATTKNADGTEKEAVKAPKPLRLESISVNMDQSTRMAILGRNGCGKSTLIKLITGALEPTEGIVTLKRQARVAYIAQHHSESLDMTSNPLDTMLKAYPGDHSLSHTNDLRNYLAQFGLGGVTLPLQNIGTLSGGQKCRVALAVALYRKPHFLIFDEPTNHLDLETSNALVNAITAFKGGVLVVSHDEYLLEKVCKDVHVVKSDGGLHRINGGIAEYKRQIIKNKR